jgi:hypothetical protein
VWLCNNGDLAGHARQTQGCGCGCRCKCKCRERQSEGRIGARAVRQVKDSGARPKTLANLWSSQAPSTVSGAGGLSKHIGGPGRPAEKRPRRRRCGNKWQRACRVLERCWSGAEVLVAVGTSRPARARARSVLLLADTAAAAAARRTRSKTATHGRVCAVMVPSSTTPVRTANQSSRRTLS